jgi:hypothetical protein
MAAFKKMFIFPVVAGFAGLLASPVSAQEVCPETLTGCELQLVQSETDGCVELIFDAPIEATEVESCYGLSMQIKNNCFGDVQVYFGEQFPTPTVIGLGETIRLEPILDAETQGALWDVQVFDGMDILDEAASGAIEFEIGYLYTPDPTCEEEPVDEEPIDEEPIDEEPIDEEPINEEPVDEEPITEQPADDKAGDSGCSSTGNNTNSSSVVLLLVFSFFAILRRRLL